MWHRSGSPTFRSILHNWRVSEIQLFTAAWFDVNFYRAPGQLEVETTCSESILTMTISNQEGVEVGVFDMPNPNRYDILSISIFCKIPLSISISIFSRMAISISISISIFFKLSLSISISISIFSKFPYRYFYRYRYFPNVLINIFSISIFSIYYIDYIDNIGVDVSSIFKKKPIYRQSISIFHQKSMKKLKFRL